MLELLRSRRSIRKYTKQPIDDKIMDLLKETILRSPSSRGINPWDFIFIEDKSTIEGLAQAKKNGSDFLKDASLAIVVAGNEQISDVWIEDCSIASIIVQLAAHSLGLGSCWVQIRNRQHSSEISSEHYVQKILAIPANIRVLSIIGIGYPAENPKPIANDKLQINKIHMNKYRVQ